MVKAPGDCCDCGGSSPNSYSSDAPCLDSICDGGVAACVYQVEFDGVVAANCSTSDCSDLFNDTALLLPACALACDLRSTMNFVPEADCNVSGDCGWIQGYGGICNASDLWRVNLHISGSIFGGVVSVTCTHIQGISFNQIIFRKTNVGTINCLTDISDLAVPFVSQAPLVTCDFSSATCKVSAT